MKQVGILTVLSVIGLFSCSQSEVKPEAEEKPVVSKKSKGLVEKQVLNSATVDMIDLSSTQFTLEADPKDWKKIEDKDGIKTYQRTTQKSDLVAFRGEAILPAPLLKVATILSNDSLRKEWIEGLVEARNIRMIKKTDRVEYNHTKVPWPFEDRDFVYRTTVKVSRKPQALLITISSVDDEGAPPVKGLVRGRVENCYYYLKEIDGGTQIIIQMAVDPKGAIPLWLMNLVQKDWPLKTLRNLRKIARREEITPTPEVREFFASAKGVK